MKGNFTGLKFTLKNHQKTQRQKTIKKKKYKPEEKEITFIKTKPIDLELLEPFDTRRKLTKVRHTGDYIPPEKNGTFKIRYCAFSIEEEEKQLKYSNQQGY